MKKIIIIFITLLCLLSCEESTKESHRYLVEEKITTLGGNYRIFLSDIDDRHLCSIVVGKYTYEHTNPGDTLIIKYE